ncbi:MAG: hypothetical protein LBD41_07835 [Clostridiales Family XIII bacterium]|jgi:hypothetical protein|nr:hypothetical protein [Clostridiales Family XIII bacterium]
MKTETLEKISFILKKIVKIFDFIGNWIDPLLSTIGNIFVIIGILLFTNNKFGSIFLIIFGLILGHICFYSAVERKIKDYLENN